MLSCHCILPYVSFCICSSTIVLVLVLLYVAQPTLELTYVVFRSGLPLEPRVSDDWFWVWILLFRLCLFLPLLPPLRWLASFPSTSRFRVLPYSCYPPISPRLVSDHRVAFSVAVERHRFCSLLACTCASRFLLPASCLLFRAVWSYPCTCILLSSLLSFSIIFPLCSLLFTSLSLTLPLDPRHKHNNASLESICMIMK